MNTEKMKVRVLVAEDETIIRLDLVEMLTESGYEVVAQAENGAVAVELAKLHKPDLAILDVKKITEINTKRGNNSAAI